MKSKPIFQLIAKDHTWDNDGSWSFMAVIHFTGELAMSEENPNTVSDYQIAEIYAFLAGYDIHIRSAGSGEAGQPFANEPWPQFWPNHIIVTQSGGLDI